jgi:acetylornithine deacetylase/succinyl-diaminopimelate desuccinylase-like protein
LNVVRIHAHIDAHFDAHLEATRAFVRQPSISADGTGMAEMAAICAAKIRALGGEAEVVPTAGHPVVWGHVRGRSAKTLLIYSMYDVQPVAGERWSVPDPFGAEVRDLPGFGRCIVSRGIFNSKGPLINLFNALDSIRAVDGTLPLSLTFMIEGEEELGSRHLPEFATAHRDRLRADAAFFPMYSQDPKGRAMNYLGVKGLVFMELIARGGDHGGPRTRAVHSSNAVWIHSPAWWLVQALSSMLSADQKQITIDGFYDDVAGPGADETTLLEALRDQFDASVPLRLNDAVRYKYDADGLALLREYLYQPSLNIDGLITGDVGPGTKTVLPHEARAKIDIRLVPRMRPERVIDQVKSHLRRNGFDMIDVVVHQHFPGAQVPLDAPAVQALLRAYARAGIGVENRPRIAASAPFWVFSDLLGVPLAVGGPGHGGRAHSPDEYATIDGMRSFEKSMVTFLEELAAALDGGSAAAR